MPPAFLYITAAIFGAIVGSFLNVVVLRDSRRKTIMTGRSACMHCGHELQWYELVPVLSFIIQGGRCRKCKKQLSWQYPVGELVVAGLAIFSLWYGWMERLSPILVGGIFASAAAFFVISAIDFRTMEVRPEYTIIAALFGGGAQILSGNLSWTEVIYGLLLGGGVIFVLAYGWKLITGKLGMGEGDIWIAAAVGALVGYPLIIPALFFAVGIGAIVGILLMISSRKGIGSEMPFGPYLALGGLLALVWGQVVLSWYIL